MSSESPSPAPVVVASSPTSSKPSQHQPGDNSSSYLRIFIVVGIAVAAAVFITQTYFCPTTEKVTTTVVCKRKSGGGSSPPPASSSSSGSRRRLRQKRKCPPCPEPEPCPSAADASGDGKDEQQQDGGGGGGAVGVARDLGADPSGKYLGMRRILIGGKGDSFAGKNSDWRATVNRQPLKVVPTYRVRADLPALIQKEGPAFKRGIELGVKMGEFAEQMLAEWKNCEEYWLVDLWKHQQNYHDVANEADQTHNHFMSIAKKKTAKYPFVKWCRNYTSECAKLFPDEYFDWVFVDARHDRKGVEEDLKTWWPKVKYGGLMMGHDYVEQFEIGAQRWDVNYDGTIDKTGKILRGAVDEFFMSGTPETNEHYRQVVVSHRELFSCWGVRK